MPVNNGRAMRILKLSYKLTPYLNIPVKGLYRWVPIFGGKTVPQLIFMAVTVLVFLVAGFSVGGISVGKVADVAAAIAIILGMRFTLIRKVLRSEVVIFWHKVFAYLAGMLLLIHCIQVGKSNTGIVMAIIVLMAPLSYLAHKFGYLAFILFYWSHFISIVVLVPVAYLHGASWIANIGTGYYLDLLLRYYHYGIKGVAKTVRVSDEVVYVEIAVGENTLKHSAGQHYYLNFPTTSTFSFHPFSAIPLITVVGKSEKTCRREEQRLCFYVRCAGVWTSQLYGLATESTIRGGDDTLGATNIPVRLEGPYGVISIDHANPEMYPSVLLVAGGIGVTPILSILSDLIERRQSSQHITLIWSARDAQMARDITNRILEPLFLYSRHDYHFTESSTTNVMHAEAVDEEHLMGEKDPSQVDLSKFCGSLTLHFFYSGEENSGSALSELLHNNWKRGRPNLSELFQDTICNTNISETTLPCEPRVAVIVCGPESMVEEVRDLCDQTTYLSKDSGRRIFVDCHEESFSK